MKTYGIRISDIKNNVLNVELSDILEEIFNGIALNWCILFLDGTPNKGEGKFVNEYKKNIVESKNGLLTNWDEIYLINTKFHQIFETVILGCKNQKFLHRYDNNQEMYQSCDVVIELVDCAFWEIYSKDTGLIDRLKAKFKDIEFLGTDFQI